jgi:hypothetical protein
MMWILGMGVVIVVVRMVLETRLILRTRMASWTVTLCVVIENLVVVVVVVVVMQMMQMM